MNWLDWARTGAALLATLALLGGAALIARRAGITQAGAPAGKRRLSIVETLFLDPRRRVVIVRIDSIEHALLLSPFGDRAIGPVPVRTGPAEEVGS